jgi:hypothetical protein
MNVAAVHANIGVILSAGPKRWVVLPHYLTSGQIDLIVSVLAVNRIGCSDKIVLAGTTGTGAISRIPFRGESISRRKGKE